MKRIVALLVVVMAVVGTMAQVETPSGDPVRGTNARVLPESMYFTCMVGETVTDTVYVYNLSNSTIDPLCAFNSSPGYIWTEARFGDIPPGGVGKSVVTYTPEAAGTHTARLSMNIGGEYYSVSMTGVATEPVEQTATPAFQGTDYPNGFLVEIIDCDDCGSYIYYRCRTMEDDWWWDWMEYTDPILFTEPGHYQVEAYAIVPGKTESYHIIYEFIVPEPPVSCYDFEENDIYYNIIDEAKVYVTSETDRGNSYSGNVTVPATVTHDGVTYMVTAIGEKAFSNCSDLTEVTIGDYVTTIDERAFVNCSGLTSIELGDYVITVGEDAFCCCYNLLSVTLGKGLNRMSDGAFSYCHQITSVTCKAATPPTMEGPDVFDSGVYQSATLNVYPPVVEDYMSAEAWSLFNNIVGEKTVSPKPSDINGDGEVDINDVTNLIDALLNAN